MVPLWQLYIPNNMAPIPEEFRHALLLLLEGRYRNPGLRFAKIGDIYRVRIGRGPRLLFSSHIEPQTQARCLVFRENPPNHKAYESTLANPNIHKKYRENPPWADYKKIMPDDLFLVDMPTSMTEATAEPEENESEEEHFLAMTDNGWIELTPQQQHILKAGLSIPMPIILEGGAGNGKTTLLIGLLVQHARAHAQGDLPLLCCTPDAKFLPVLIRMFEKECPPEYQQYVHFKTNEQLIRDLYPDKVLVDEAYFNSFLDQYVPDLSLRKLFKDDSRMISGCLSLDEYQLFGRKHSVLTLDQKAQFWPIFQRYLTQLQENDQISTSYVIPQAHRLYKTVFADETQACSAAQLETIFKLSGGKFVCNVDLGQRLQDRRFKQSDWIERKFSQTFTRFELITHFRCPPDIQELVEIYRNIGSSSPIPDRKPSLSLAIQMSDSLKQGSEIEKKIINAATRHDFAIVTREGKVDEMKTTFNTDNVFTPHQVLGQEYCTILVIDVYTREEFVRLAKFLASQSEKTKNQRLTAGDYDEKDALLRQWHVAFTRITAGKDNQFALFVVQEGLSPSQASIFFPAFSRYRENEISLKEVQPSSKEEWTQHAKRLEQYGLEEHAAKTRERHLSPNPPLQKDSLSVNSPIKESSPKTQTNSPAKNTLEKLEKDLATTCFSSNSLEQIFGFIKKSPTPDLRFTSIFFGPHQLFNQLISPQDIKGDILAGYLTGSLENLYFFIIQILNIKAQSLTLQEVRFILRLIEMLPLSQIATKAPQIFDVILGNDINLRTYLGLLKLNSEDTTNKIDVIHAALVFYKENKRTLPSHVFFSKPFHNCVFYDLFELNLAFELRDVLFEVTTPPLELIHEFSSLTIEFGKLNNWVADASKRFPIGFSNFPTLAIFAYDNSEKPWFPKIIKKLLEQLDSSDTLYPLLFIPYQITMAGKNHSFNFLFHHLLCVPWGLEILNDLLVRAKTPINIPEKTAALFFERTIFLRISLKEKQGKKRATPRHEIESSLSTYCLIIDPSLNGPFNLLLPLLNSCNPSAPIFLAKTCEVIQQVIILTCFLKTASGQLLLKRVLEYCKEINRSFPISRSELDNIQNKEGAVIKYDDELLSLFPPEPGVNRNSFFESEEKEPPASPAERLTPAPS